MTETIIWSLFWCLVVLAWISPGLWLLNLINGGLEDKEIDLELGLFRSLPAPIQIAVCMVLGFPAWIMSFFGSGEGYRD